MASVMKYTQLSSFILEMEVFLVMSGTRTISFNGY